MDLEQFKTIVMSVALAGNVVTIAMAVKICRSSRKAQRKPKAQLAETIKIADVVVCTSCGRKTGSPPKVIWADTTKAVCEYACSSCQTSFTVVNGPV